MIAGEETATSGDCIIPNKEVAISDSDKFVTQILNGPNEQCQENFRMDKPVFYKLCHILQTRGLLRHTNRIKIEEQLAIFLFIIGHNLRTRAVQELFGYSGETISRHFNNVLNAVTSISTSFFQSTSPDVDQSDPYFKDCIGVVDCIHMPVMVGVDEQGPFRNGHNGLLTQNVLVASSFDLRFNYVLAGWEGSASDQQVLDAALTRPNKLQVPQGKYYIVDSKYQNLPGFIAPYRGGVSEPKGVFNERHKVLHRAVDRALGALKERFPILLSAPPYPLQTQVKLVIAACALHNYVRLEKPDDFVFRMFEEDTLLAETTEEEDRGMALGEEENEGHEHGLFGPEEVEDSLRLRDEIASNLWNHYVQNLPTF
ncbi:putative nuclease HARBI1 [Brassica napus]|uniref:putative nuclease HARBI1 n=1 Tax=Brassica napus TaxID=3708 RepID=UPI00207883BD|nr:putative nuclease HARBI1 [Brassica napus]